MASNGKCAEEYEGKLLLFNILTFVSIIFTFVVVIVYNTCLANDYQANPLKASKFWYSLAGVKIVLGTTMLVFFEPTCPQGCVCYGTSFDIYPFIAIAVGISWASRGYRFSQIAAATVEGAPTTTGEVNPESYDKVPMVEAVPVSTRVSDEVV